MSVLIPDLQVYNYIQTGLQRLAYNNIVDDLFSNTVNKYFRNCPDYEKEAERLVLSWLKMNIESYNKRCQVKETTDLIGLYYPTFPHKDLTACQLLKYLQCVEYNIEIVPKDLQQRKDLQLLKDCIDDLLNSIVHNLPEYNKATWCN